MKQKNLHLGYDIGGTKIELILLDDKSQVLFQKRLPTERDKGYEHILSVLKALFQDCLAKTHISSESIASIGLALPGTVDPQPQIMVIGNTRVLEGKDITKDLLHTLNINIPIFTANDANCFAFAEFHAGAGKALGAHNMVGVILGTGVGGGVIIDGKIYSGTRGSAGEIGHIFLKTKNQKCYCGQMDCAELSLSGSGLHAAFFEETGKKESASVILQNEKFAEKYRQDLALFLGRLANIFDPDCFVLGGGVSKTDTIYNNLESLMIPHLFYKNNPPKILKHGISDSAGSLGAALLYKLN